MVRKNMISSYNRGNLTIYELKGGRTIFYVHFKGGRMIFRRPIRSMGRLYISRCVCVYPRHFFGSRNFGQNPSIVSIS